MTTRFIVKLGLAGLSPIAVVERGRAHVAAMTGNPAFASPTPTLAAITTACDALEAAEIAVLSNGGRQDTLVRNERLRVLKDLLRELAGYVQALSHGVPEVIGSAGFSTRKPPSPTGVLPAPGDLRVRFTLLPGELKARWNAVKDRFLYELQISEAGPTVEDGFRTLILLGRNYFTAKGLTSFRDYSFRVRALGAAGHGAWSDVATAKPL